MAAIVLIVGLIVLGMGILVLISPASLKRMLHIFVAKQWWYFVTGVRILVGILFILVASETRSPLFVRTVGVLFILAGLVVPLMELPESSGWSVGGWRDPTRPFGCGLYSQLPLAQQSCGPVSRVKRHDNNLAFTSFIVSFLHSLFSKISPQCNIANGNQRDESWALVCFSYRSPLEGKHLGKLYAD